MEFASFRAMNDSPRNKIRPPSAAQDPWLPPGKNRTHQRMLGLPSRQEIESAAVEAAQSEAAAQRSAVAARLTSAEAAFDRLEDQLNEVLRNYEKHVISASASAVLVAKKLSELGVGA